MAAILVNNISDITNPPGGPRVVDISGTRIYPGRSAMVAESDLTPTLLLLRGTFIELGLLPASMKKAATEESLAPMTEDEIRAYLEKLSLAKLLELADGVTPPPTKRANSARMVHALLRACRNPDSLDPELFFFTRKWTRQPGNVFVPVE